MIIEADAIEVDAIEAYASTNPLRVLIPMDAKNKSQFGIPPYRADCEVDATGAYAPTNP